MLNLSCRENGFQTGNLSFKKEGLLGNLRVRPSVISITSAFSKDRDIIERFITEKYESVYEARINVRYPILMSVRDESGKTLAAIGFRSASNETLFLEQYLSAPVEEVLQTSRDRIVEIGNLASNGGGASLYLFAALAAYLNYKGFIKAVATSTDFLERRFRQMGLQPRRHAKADSSLLSSGGEYWGTYYDARPNVISGSVAQGYARLQRQLGAEYTDCRPRLFPRLHFKGEQP